MHPDDRTEVTPIPTEEPQRLLGLGRWLVGLIVVTALVHLAMVVADAGQLDVYNRLVAGEDVSFEQVTASDDRVGITALLGFVVFVVTFVVWIVWFRRVYGNLARLTPIPLRFGRGWAIGGWFVPLFNYIRPKQIANDIWRACDPAPQNAVFIWERRVSPLLNVW